MGSMQTLEKSIFFPTPVEEVFQFHTCMTNMCRLLPEHLDVKIVGAPCYVELGDIVTLKVSLHALSFRWETMIIEYEKNVRFVDILRHGPFSVWRHHHIFEAQDKGTFMTDRIEYKVGFSLFGGFASHFFVRGELERIFESRHKKALQHFKQNKKQASRRR